MEDLAQGKERMLNSSSHTVSRPVIALLTDFGLNDGYVGVLKGVMQGITPDAQLIDITHTIAPQHVASGAWILRTSYRYFPAGTIFTCIVDPGVGSTRYPLALRAGDWLFVGPDNGLFTYILREQPIHEVVTLANPTYQLPQVSTTFHGRDIFAPTAAYLATGLALTALGPYLDPSTLHMLPGNDATRDALTIKGYVVHIDTYGNIITNIPRSLVPDLFSSPHIAMTFSSQLVSITQRRHFFSEQPAERGQSDAPFLYVDSSGFIAVALNRGNAANTLGIGYDAPITFVLSSDASE